VTELRAARAEDAEAIYRIHAAAFGRNDEAELVRKVSRRAAECVSLVATEAGAVIGHILFSPVSVVGHSIYPAPMGLAPVAVDPSVQRGGAGKLLCRAGIEQCRSRGAPFVLVLGHPSYYPKFGFVPAERFGLHFADFPPRDSFMALELRPGALSGVRGSVRYAPEFHEA
jgi:putative acetyltransferase